MVLETIAAGGQACRPYLAPQGLSVAFVEPALEFLRSHGGTVMFAHQLRRLVLADGRVCGLDFGDSTTAVGADDAVVLAVPSYAAGSIVPGLQTPVEYRAIINAHFRLSPPAIAPMIGVLHGVGRMDFRLRRPHLGHHQRRRTAAGNFRGTKSHR